MNFLVKKTISLLESLGDFSLFIWTVFYYSFSRPFFIDNFKTQFVKIGYESLFIITATSISVGFIFALQLGDSIKSGYIADLDALGFIIGNVIIKEFAPILAAIMITARIGSSIATEIGSMKISEQTYALKSLAVNPIQYLVSPRLLAMVIILPLFTLISYFASLIAGALGAKAIYDQDFDIFMGAVQNSFVFKDVVCGLVKSFFYGIEIVLISTYQGLKVKGGAADVGKATTSSVTQCNIAITSSDFILNYIIIRFF